jgi:ribulose-phosphate 3-epimerase
MRSYASLWSADLLAISRSIAPIEDEVDGFHIDVFDGHNTKELLFGPGFVAALRKRTAVMLDIHLNVDDPDYWARRFIDAGADMITIQLNASADIAASLDRVRQDGCRTGLGLELGDAPPIPETLVGRVDRVLLMGTEIGVKGVEFHDSVLDKVRTLIQSRPIAALAPEVVVDGGIRRHTVPAIAAAGADGVVPGSLVFGDKEPAHALAWIRSLGTGERP